MGTHPIFESDFDCLTGEIYSKMKSGGKKVLILSIIELVIHGALLGLGAYFVFTSLEEGLAAVPLNLNVNGISFSIGWETLQENLGSDTIQNIILGIQLGVIIPLALGLSASLTGLIGALCGKSGRCCFVLHGILGTIMAILYGILALVCIGGLAVINTDVLNNVLNEQLNQIDFTSIAGKSAGDFQNLIISNDVAAEDRQIEDFADALGGVDIGNAADLLTSVDIDQLGSLIPGVNFDSLDFETLDVNNPEQLQAFADVIQESNVDLASIAENFDPSALLEGLDASQLLNDSGIKLHLNIALGVGLGIFIVLFAIMVSSCCIACKTKGNKIA